MKIQEGKITSVLGTVVTGAGIMMLKMKVSPKAACWCGRIWISSHCTWFNRFNSK